MHLITDEHGNPIPHSGHDHDGHDYAHGDHEHSHEHSHGDLTHTHEHHHHGDENNHNHLHGDHDHSHEHTRAADDSDMSQADRNRIMLDYMIDHNNHHIQEMEDLARKLEQTGNKEAAENIRLAKDLFSQGNQLLGEVEI